MANENRKTHYRDISGLDRMSELIVKSRVKEALDGMNVSADFYDELDERVEALLDDANRRAEENGRKTVQPRDL